MPQTALNPFIYPGPVPVDSFVNREEALHTLLSRIATGQNTALVGLPRPDRSLGTQTRAQVLCTTNWFLDKPTPRTCQVYPEYRYERKR